jgi:hypothetical protein
MLFVVLPRKSKSETHVWKWSPWFIQHTGRLVRVRCSYSIHHPHFRLSIQLPNRQLQMDEICRNGIVVLERNGSDPSKIIFGHDILFRNRVRLVRRCSSPALVSPTELTSMPFPIMISAQCGSREAICRQWCEQYGSAAIDKTWSLRPVLDSRWSGWLHWEIPVV